MGHKQSRDDIVLLFGQDWAQFAEKGVGFIIQQFKYDFQPLFKTSTPLYSMKKEDNGSF